MPRITIRERQLSSSFDPVLNMRATVNGWQFFIPMSLDIIYGAMLTVCTDENSYNDGFCFFAIAFKTI
jgi:hypothetical protein